MTRNTRPPEELPEDADALRQAVQARDAEIQMLRVVMHKLELQLARRSRMIFGSASERFADGTPAVQGSLLEGEVLDGIEPKKPTAAAVSPAANTAANDKTVDRSLPAHLPRQAQVHRPDATSAHHDGQGQPCGCGECGGRLREIGRDVSEQLEYVPGRFKVVRHVRPKLACVGCQRVFQAAAPSASRRSSPRTRTSSMPCTRQRWSASARCDVKSLTSLSRPLTRLVTRPAVPSAVAYLCMRCWQRRRVKPRGQRIGPSGRAGFCEETASPASIVAGGVQG